jgi:hypothetical protein
MGYKQSMSTKKELNPFEKLILIVISFLSALCLLIMVIVKIKTLLN